MRFATPLAFGLACTAAFARADGDRPEGRYPPVVVNNAEVRVLPRTREDRQYQLYVGLPASFRTSPERRYPVVFVTDGYYDFQGVLSTYSNLFWDKSVPEMIVVGIGYVGDHPDYEVLRVDDLTPMQFIKGNRAGGGQAAQFLHMIETEAIPLLERDYRADPAHRILMGCSLGGCFTLYAMFSRPDLFQGFVAVGPFVAQLWQYEDEFAKSGRAVDARVFVSTAEYEWPNYHNDILLFNERLQTRSYFKGGYHFRIVENMRHAGEKAEGYTQGLRYVAETMAETGPSVDQYGDPAGAVYEVAFAPAAALKEASSRTPGQADLLAKHLELLKQRAKARSVVVVLQTPDADPDSYSSFFVIAKDRREAEEIAASDPAVAAGLLTFEVFLLRLPHGESGN
jgi:hypothetical protein